MSTHWTFYAFAPARFHRELADPDTGIANVRTQLDGGGKDSIPEARHLTPARLEALAKFGLDYNTLPRKHWKALDMYYRLGFRQLVETTPESERPAAVTDWSDLLECYRDRKGRDVDTFAALAGEGKRYRLTERPATLLDRLTMALHGAPCDYLILEGEALHTFCRHLQALFYVNPWDWPTHMEEQEKMYPHFVAPFLRARDGAGGLYALRGGPATHTRLRTVEPVEELQP